MKILLILTAMAALFSLGVAGCGSDGGKEEAEATEDGTSSEATAGPDSSQTESTLRDAAQEILTPRQPPSGAAALVHEAQSAADQANQRAEELQRMMEGM